MITGNAPLYGVYTLGNYARNYPMVLDFTYPMSCSGQENTDLNVLTTNVEIGSMLVCGNDIFVSWYDHDSNTYGVDKLDMAYKLDGAYLETVLLSIDRDEFATFTEFLVAYCEMPTGTDILINYSTDYGTTWNTTAEVKDTMRQLIRVMESPESSTLQLRIIARTTGNATPLIESAMISGV
jgi:hypothetical protein